MAEADNTSQLRRPKRLDPSKHRFSVELGENVFVAVSDFEDNVYVNIRQYATDINGQCYPTKKGATLTPLRWNEFLGLINNIEEAFRGLRTSQSTEPLFRHLGGNWHVTVSKSYPRVDIRRFWLPEGANEIVPTKKGISLSFSQFTELRSVLDDVNSHLPELMDVVPCVGRDDHQNQLGALRCSECNPNDHQNW